MINKILPIQKEFYFETEIFKIKCAIKGDVNIYEAKEINLKFKGLDFVDFKVTVIGDYQLEINPKILSIPNEIHKELKLIEGYAKVVARDNNGNMNEVEIVVTNIEENTGKTILDSVIMKALSTEITKAANEYLKK